MNKQPHGRGNREAIAKSLRRIHKLVRAQDTRTDDEPADEAEPIAGDPLGLDDALVNTEADKQEARRKEDAAVAAAKKKLLQEPSEAPRPRYSNEYPRSRVQEDNSLGRAANRYVSMQMVGGVIAFIAFLVFLIVFILPTFNRVNSGFPRF